MAPDIAPAILHISLQRHIWRVTLDGVFYGDYREKSHAVESAETAALGLRKSGREVRIVTA